MLAKPRQTVIADVIDGLKRASPRDVIVHEPIRDIHLQDLLRDLKAMLRDCDHLSMVVIKHHV